MSQEPAPNVPIIGQRVGHFRIRVKIGGGAASEVYLAEHEGIQTRAAIKILHPHISTKPDHVRRFFNEAIAASEIRHAGVVKIFDAGWLPCGRAFLVMEYLDGETLTRRIRRAGRLPAAELAEITRQISNVLEATHEAGITHRDLKPDNVFLVRDAELACGERVKLLDFGLAKLARSNVTGTSIGAMGTPDYMAPEQWEDVRGVDWRADAYALGCVVFEMATGRVPFPASNLAAAYAKHRNAPPPAICGEVAGFPVELDQLVRRLMDKRVECRPAAMLEVTRTFAAFAAEHPLERCAPITVATATAAPRSHAPLCEAAEDARPPARSRFARDERGVGRGLVWVLVAIAAVLLGILVTLVVAVEQADRYELARGSVNQNVVPLPSSLSTAIDPP